MLNVVAGVGVLLFANNHSSNSEISVKIISNHIFVNNQGDIIADDTVRRILDEKQAWVMLLDEDGLVIWQNNMPKDLPTKYTATDIAKFSRWYLEEYPTYVYEHLAGLLVIVGAPNSLVKWHYTMDTQYTSLLLGGIVFVGVANIFLIKASNHLLKREQARVEWINGISHDVRTPLAIMLGYASEIEEDNSLPEKTRGQAGMIRQQGIKLRQLIMDLNEGLDEKYSFDLLASSKLDTLNNGVFTKKTDQAMGETTHGLGLQLAKQIIQAHHGDIHFEQGIPNGLKVCISIPINQCR